MAKPLENYVEVSERIEKFYERYPEGSLRCKSVYPVEINGEHFLVYIAQAFRTADDQAPAEGAAWEPVPGKTNFTKDSELMNAETSAWGRAIAALGFEVNRGIASRQEVQNRRGPGGGDGQPAGSAPPARSGVPSGADNGLATPAQKGATSRFLNDLNVPAETQVQVVHARAGKPPSAAGLREINAAIARADYDWLFDSQDIPRPPHLPDTGGLEPVGARDEGTRL